MFQILKKIKKTSVILLTLTSLFTACSGDSNSKMQYLKIGTGSQVGVYYTAGLSIADIVNQEEDSIDLAVESTAGSVFNINALLSGELDFGFAQSDRQYQAYNGLLSWKGNPKKNLRFICSLHPETVSLLAADDSEITSIEKVKDKVISIGAPGSGTRGNALDCLEAVNLKENSDYYSEGLGVTNASMMLQEGRIDAFFYTAGHPNGSLLEATNGKRTVHFVPITKTEDIINKNPYYFKMSIAKDLYPRASNTEDIPTIGMLTTLLTTKDLSEQTVYLLTKNLFEKLEEFKSRHPSLARLTPEKMLRGAFAPIHPGALKYYQEIGLIKK